MKALRPTTVKNVLRLLQDNKSFREVATELSISKSSVHSIAKKPPTTRSHLKGGRLRKFSYRDALFCDCYFIAAQSVPPSKARGGCITWDGPGFLVKIDSILDAELYIRILKEDLWATVDWHNIDPQRFIFQQDNDSKHIA
ncbi:hypothetical protein BGZ54_008878 [Gamsiella multidivaricata]|nr:hypothetical protein BGZ54_008878 [Gamsiella multidivaricata]